MHTRYQIKRYTHDNKSNNTHTILNQMIQMTLNTNFLSNKICKTLIKTTCNTAHHNITVSKQSIA